MKNPHADANHGLFKTHAITFGVDARLIAAAPDGLAALESCTPLLVLALHYAEQSGDAEYRQRLRAAIAANNAAIAKARGEE